MTVVPGQTITFTYQVKVLAAAVDLKSLVNTAQWLTLKDTTTHSVNPPAEVDIPKTGSNLNPVTTLNSCIGTRRLVEGLSRLVMARKS